MTGAQSFPVKSGWCPAHLRETLRRRSACAHKRIRAYAAQLPWARDRVAGQTSSPGVWGDGRSSSGSPLVGRVASRAAGTLGTGSTGNSGGVPP